MRKSRRNLTIINNEIDYDKLAEAIIKANTNSQETYSPSRECMKYVLNPVFWCVAIFTEILAIAMFVSILKSVTTVFASGNLNQITALFFEFALTLFMAGFSIITIITAKEIDKENDRNYIASMFSNIVAIAALVISLIALLKGVR